MTISARVLSYPSERCQEEKQAGAGPVNVYLAHIQFMHQTFCGPSPEDFCPPARFCFRGLSGQSFVIKRISRSEPQPRYAINHGHGMLTSQGPKLPITLPRVAYIPPLLAWVALCLAAGPAPVFETRSPQGVDFVLQNSPTPQKYLIETMPGGVALLDYNNDGLLDIFLVNGGRITSPCSCRKTSIAKIPAIGTGLPAKQRRQLY